MIENNEKKKKEKLNDEENFIEEDADRYREMEYDSWANEGFNQSESDMFN